MIIAEVNSIAGVIQLAVAPVFLLAGISGFVNVLTGRLSRIVDRVRYLRSVTTKLTKSELAELRVLGRRVRLVNLASSFCTFAAIMVCWLIVVLFVLYFLEIHAPFIIALMFVVTMLSLISGLLLFQAEIFLAIQTVRIMRL